MRLTAVICLIVKESPSDEQLEQVAHFVGLCRDAVGNALHVLALQELIIKDDTASCFNRRHFEEFLPEELARASRFRSPVSLIFSTWTTSSKVNIATAIAWKSDAVRGFRAGERQDSKFDKHVRFGGDEFCIVLPETEWHGAVELLSVCDR